MLHQSSLRDYRASLPSPSDESLGYYQPSLRDEMWVKLSHLAVRHRHETAGAARHALNSDEFSHGPEMAPCLGAAFGLQ